MKRISVCMILKDEEKVIARALSCINKFADEIVIVDTGSKDKTIEIAKEFTDKVFNFTWCDDFSKARNFSIDKASFEYVMWLDADDVILDDDIDKILALKKVNDDTDIYMFKYVLTHDENYKPTFEYYRERLFKNLPIFRFKDPVHEVIVPSGKIRYMDIKIYHEKLEYKQTKRNLKIYQKMKRENVKFSARQQFYFARELMQNGYNQKAITEFKKFLKRSDTWIVNRKEAYLNLAEIYFSLSDFNSAKKVILKGLEECLQDVGLWYLLGEINLKQNHLNEAIFCYKSCLNISPNLDDGGFINLDEYEFLPNLQLCYCYYKLGDIKTSKTYHEKCKKLKPDDKSVKYNEEYFKSIDV